MKIRIGYLINFYNRIYCLFLTLQYNNNLIIRISIIIKCQNKKIKTSLKQESSLLHPINSLNMINPVLKLLYLLIKLIKELNLIKISLRESQLHYICYLDISLSFVWDTSMLGYLLWHLFLEYTNR